ncbi:magnesium transporter nipa [Plasmopara halstedii]|uniref:Magnesium transporter nipa n=1 Tax=Plasmopara halstedii TaxID=4781 RepID=A0A0P1AJB7_PLAHL|nr:magnesium transporter nipa [Plasmopara halstedii]CEG40682.1 magnesium transporter nipa [Plasmopara halstedii]|eukprot:XP_024577051.1 magnesium transporter nipa [Plasmopara halstedii]
MWFIGWPLGLVLSAISSIFGIAGKLLLKLAHLERDKEELAAAQSKLRKSHGAVSIPMPSIRSNMGVTYFYCGLFSMLVMNPALGALAYCFATQSLLAPMAGLTIGWNTLFGPILLPHERLTTNDFVGAVLIFTGCVLVGVSGTHDSPPLPVELLGARFKSFSFVLYLVALFVLLCFLIHHAKDALHFTTTSRRAGVKSSPVSSPEQLSVITRVSLSVFAGVMSGQLFFLAAVMQAVHDDGASRIWSFPVTYICVIGALGTAIFGLYLLNEALAVEDAVVVIYLYEASYIMAGAVSGLCFFRDMEHLATWHYVLYSLSLALILLGIYVVAKRSLTTNAEDEDGKLLLLKRRILCLEPLVDWRKSLCIEN